MKLFFKLHILYQLTIYYIVSIFEKTFNPFKWDYINTSVDAIVAFLFLGLFVCIFSSTIYYAERGKKNE
jgi:hypothetical protein